MRVVDGLWSRAPELRRRARRQAWNLRIYQDMQRHPWALTSERFAESVAVDIGSRAGKLMALRIEAYDRLQRAGDACCPDAIAARGNDTDALTCHCGAPCAYESGDCARCGARPLRRDR